MEAYTAVLPWYEREDFQRLWELAADRNDIPPDYEVWYAAALNVMNTWLARGRALQIVRINPDEFLSWLRAKGLQNTAATRLQYVEEKASGSVCTAGIAGVAAQSNGDPNPL